MVVKEAGRFRSRRGFSLIRSIFPLQSLNPFSTSPPNPKRSSRFYNTVHEVCKISQDVFLFFGGIMLGTGQLATGIGMLILKVVIGFIDEEISYRKAFTLTKEAVNGVQEKS